MKLRVASQTIDDWATALKRARHREIGGILFGEHVGDADFRIVEATIQARGGNEVTFWRKAGKARRDFKSMSRRYGNDPERFNYLGEWHSHPHAPAVPSHVDEITMFQLLSDPETTVNFLILLINCLNEQSKLELSAVAYLASGQKIPCNIVVESCEKES